MFNSKLHTQEAVYYIDNVCVILNIYCKWTYIGRGYLKRFILKDFSLPSFNNDYLNDCNDLVKVILVTTERDTFGI